MEGAAEPGRGPGAPDSRVSMCGGSHGRLRGRQLFEAWLGFPTRLALSDFVAAGWAWFPWAIGFTGLEMSNSGGVSLKARIC